MHSVADKRLATPVTGRRMCAAPRDGKDELNAEMSQPAAQVDDLGISRTDEAQA